MKGIKSNEKIEVTCTTLDKRVFIITSNDNRSLYYLYNVKDGQAIKTDKKAKSVEELENKYVWIK